MLSPDGMCKSFDKDGESIMLTGTLLSYPYVWYPVISAVMLTGTLLSLQLCQLVPCYLTNYVNWNIVIIRIIHVDWYPVIISI